MSEISPEEIQRAVDEVRRGGFGDFMFRIPDPLSSSSESPTERGQKHNKTTESNDNNQALLNLDDDCGDWRCSVLGSMQTQSRWLDGNMCEFRAKKRK